MKYFAFISYSRKDKEIANWICTKLEKYPYPEEWVKEENRPTHTTYIRKVFLDLKDLEVSERRFDEDIKKKLQESRYLIVLCSKNSAKSTYVNNEIKYFLETHNNQSELILPVFIDGIEDENIPPVLINLNIQERNCPIYNTHLRARSEANLYCFYHIVSFLLKVDFPLIYNRYEQYAAKKHQKRKTWGGIFLSLLLLVIVFLSISLNRQIELNDKQKELTKFEKEIFPLSIVFGYESNFLKPSIKYLKEKQPDFKIYILMPYNREDLNHQERIAKAGRRLIQEFQADTIISENLPTSMKRGTRIGKMVTPDDRYKDIFIDFASTTTTFAQIIDHKKNKYPEIDDDETIKYYTDTFIRQTKERLEGDSIYVCFTKSQDDFINAIKAHQGN